MFLRLHLSVFILWLLPYISIASDVIPFPNRKNKCALFFTRNLSQSLHDATPSPSPTVVKIRIPLEMRRMHSIVPDTPSLPKALPHTVVSRFIQGVHNVTSTDQAAKTAPVEEAQRYAPTRTKTVRIDSGIIKIVTSASKSRAEDFNHRYPTKTLMPQGEVEFDMTDIQRSFARRPINYFSSGINTYALTPANTLAVREAPALNFQNRVLVDSLPIGSLQQIANSNSSYIGMLNRILENRDHIHPDFHDFNVAYVSAGFPQSARLEMSGGGERGAFHEDANPFVLAVYNASPQRASEITEQMGHADLIIDFVGLASRRPLGEILKFFYESSKQGAYAVLFLPTEFKSLETAEAIEFVKFFSNPKTGTESTPYSFFNRIPGFRLINLFKRNGIQFTSTRMGENRVPLTGPSEFNGIVIYLQKDSSHGNPIKDNLGIEEANSSGMRFLSLEQGLQVIEQD